MECLAFHDANKLLSGRAAIFADGRSSGPCTHCGDLRGRNNGGCRPSGAGRASGSSPPCGAGGRASVATTPHTIAHTTHASCVGRRAHRGKAQLRAAGSGGVPHTARAD